MNKRRPFVWGLFLLASILGAYCYTSIRFSSNVGYAPGSLSALFNQTAVTPFQYRMLVPGVVILLHKMMALVGAVVEPGVLFGLVEWLSVVLLVATFRKYISLFFDETSSYVLSFSIFFVLPFHFIFGDYLVGPDYQITAYYYPWDTPSLVFFCMGLFLIHEERWKEFLCLFAVATLNRETSCFLTFIFLFTKWSSLSPRRLMLLTICQFFIWTAIKATLHIHYTDNPGSGIYQDQWVQNSLLIGYSETWISLLRVWGYLGLPLLLTFPLIQNDFARRSLYVIPIYLGSLFFVGTLVEMRIYAEMIPVVLTGFLLVLKELKVKMIG